MPLLVWFIGALCASSRKNIVYAIIKAAVDGGRGRRAQRMAKVGGLWWRQKSLFIQTVLHRIVIKTRSFATSYHLVSQARPVRSRDPWLRFAVDICRRIRRTLSSYSSIMLHCFGSGSGYESLGECAQRTAPSATCVIAEFESVSPGFHS